MPGLTSAELPGQDSASGRTFGRYQLQELVSVGEMGVVYRAWDPWLECIVAIKLVSEDKFPDEAARQQLLTEARIASSLTYPDDHSAICKIRTVEEHAGKAGIIMEWVDGQVLTRIIPAGVGLPLAHVIGYGMQIADAVAHAHSRGVIHRDLKSGNVMVAADGHIKLMDFGLSRIQSRIEVSDQLETAEFESSSSEAMVGTPPYWAPEVLRRQAIDARTDIWSFGVLLYEIAAGSMPFTGGTVFELGSAILKDAPAQLPPHVPEDLARVIDRCLQKNAAQRYQKITDVRAELEAIEYSSSLQPRRTPERQRLVTLPSVAVLPLENHSADAQQEYFADGLTEALITSLTKLGTLRVISRTSVMPYKRTTKTLRQIARELSVEAVLEGSVLRDGERVRINAELIDARTEQLLWAESYERNLQDILALQSEVASAVATEIRRKLSPIDRSPLDAAPARENVATLTHLDGTNGSAGREKALTQVNPEAYDLYLQGRYLWNNEIVDQDFKAAEYYKRAIEIDPNSALAYSGLAHSFTRMMVGEYSLVAPADIAPKAKENALKAIELDETLAEAHVALAMVNFRFEHNWEAAEKEFLRAIELKDGDSVAHYTYSIYLMVSSRFDEALREVKIAQNLNPLSPAIDMSLGLLLYLSGQYQEATVQIGATIARFPTFPLARLVRGLICMHDGKVDDAGAEIKAAMDSAGPIPLWQGFLGQTYGLAGRRTDALNILHDLRQASLPKRRPYVPPVALALVEASLGEVDQAFSALDRAVKERDGLLIYLKVGAVFDSLRSDKRFSKLLTQVGLQEEPQVDVRHPEGPVPSPPIPVPPLPSPRRRWSNGRILRAVAAAAGAIVIVLAIRDYLYPPRAPKVMLAVEGVRNLSGDPLAQRLGNGLKENLFTSLSQLAPGKVGLTELTPAEAELSLAQKCQQAQARYVLVSGVEREGDNVVVTDRLLSCEDHTVVVGGRYEANLTADSFIGTEIRIANEIVQQVLAGLPKDSQPQHRVDSRAYEAYLKGRYLWAQRTTQSLTQAMTFFQKAIEYDAKYAPSYAGLADCYALLGSAPNTNLSPSEAFPKAEANARKALDLDPGLAEAHVSMGYSQLVYERNYASSRNEFQTALNLRPNYATAHQYYAYYLTSMRNVNEAIQERQRAVELEPASPLLNVALGEAYYQAHQFDQSLAYSREALSLDPHFAVAVIRVGLSFEQKRMYPDARHAFQSILQFAPNDPALLALVGHNYAVSGRTASALQIVAQLKRMKKFSYVSSLYIALVYTGLDNKDEAFAWLDKAYKEHCEYLVYLATEPLADPLRGDPRFDILLRNLGLTN